MRYRVVDGDGLDVFHISTDSTSTYGVITVKQVHRKYYLWLVPTANVKSTLLSSHRVSVFQRLDFETKRIYTLKVEAANTHTDKRFSANGPYSDITTVQVSVEDVDEPPQFSSTLYYAEVREDAKIGTVLITVSARDPDAANNSVRWEKLQQHSKHPVFVIKVWLSRICYWANLYHSVYTFWDL